MKTRHTAGARTGLTRSALARAVAGTLAFGLMLPAAAQTYTEAGQAGNPDSWVTPEFEADWGLAAINAQYAYARGLTGRGVRVGVFDSGVDLRHGEFAGKQHRGLRIADLLEDGTLCANETDLAGDNACFMSDGDRASLDYFDYTDEDRALVAYLISIGYWPEWVADYFEDMAGFSYSTHGTHVAGTIAGNRDGNGAHGVAFGADFATARLFSNSYQDFYGFFGLDGGVSLAIGPSAETVSDMYEQMAADGVRVINHSWGWASEPTTVEDMDWLYANYPEYFATYANPSLERGIIQVFAAGNGSGDIAGILATLPRAIPELEQYWLSVVNLSWTGELDGSSSICGFSMEWCITAPGTDITSSVVGGEITGEVIRDENGNVIGTRVTDEQPEFGYGDLTGTSMAAPHVTGALALLIERFPYLTNPQIRDILLTTATDIGAAGVDEIYGWGLMDLKKAIEGPGMLRVDTDVVMNRRAGGIKVWEGLAWDDWTNDISGPGRLTKSGIGWLRLSGDNTFAGATVKQGVLELDGDNVLAGDIDVDGGFFVVNGSITGSDLTVNSGGSAFINGLHAGASALVNAGGLVGGDGVINDLTVRGTVAPGNGIGTLGVTGTFTQAAGSFYDAQLAANGLSDLIAVQGDAVLQGGTVRLSAAPNTFVLGNTYTLLTATGGVDGTFAALDTRAFSPFLAFGLTYGANAVALDVTRGMALADAAQTRNQAAVARAVDAMADNAPLLLSLTQLFPAEAEAAFDMLSGEAYASAHSVLFDASRAVRQTALERSMMTAAPGMRADGHTGLWAEGIMTGGDVETDGNAARIDAQGQAVLIGADHRFAGGWTIGALAGTGTDEVAVADRGSRGQIDTDYLGVYGGTMLGGFGLRSGVVYARHDIDMRRRVAFNTIDETMFGQQDADTLQGFVEGSFRFGTERWSVVPFLQYTHVRVESDAFTEQGGTTALTVQDASNGVDMATAGVRFNAYVGTAAQEPGWLHLSGTLGYRHADGDLTPAVTAGWAGTPAAFTVEGATIADGAMVGELGVGAWLTPRTHLQLGYMGQYADEARDHAVNARIAVQF